MTGIHRRQGADGHHTPRTARSTASEHAVAGLTKTAAVADPLHYCSLPSDVPQAWSSADHHDRASPHVTEHYRPVLAVGQSRERK
jgi:hypothetical protein